LKWARNSRHTLFTYNLLRFMACHGNLAFYATGRSFDVLKKLIDGCKVCVSDSVCVSVGQSLSDGCGGVQEKALRDKCLVYVRDFVRDVNKTYVREQVEARPCLVLSLSRSLSLPVG
jgi:hypothetical protein